MNKRYGLIDDSYHLTPATSRSIAREKEQARQDIKAWWAYLKFLCRPCYLQLESFGLLALNHVANVLDNFRIGQGGHITHILAI